MYFPHVTGRTSVFAAVSGWVGAGAPRAAVVLAFVSGAAAAAADPVLTVLHDFAGGAGGGQAFAAPIQGSDGRLFGTTAYGGATDTGTVYVLNTDGTGFDVLADLDSASLASLIEGLDGRFYGVTLGGGQFGGGTVFVVNADGSEFDVLREFDFPGDGGTLFGQLLQLADGRLHGVTETGGNQDLGTIFALDPDGTDFVVLRHLDTSETTGAFFPRAGLIQGSD
jgi:uncharacterized repeat protein (TIGR03803 family)